MVSAELPDELVEWFAQDIDPGDAPELHVIDLEPGDLERCFAVLGGHRPRWSDRRFHIDSEDVDVTVNERPEVASLVASGAASVACIGAEDLLVGDRVLPLVEMFLFPRSIQFFWWPSQAWSSTRVAGFLVLLKELLDATAAGKLCVDIRYPTPSRSRIRGALVAAGVPSTRLAD